MLTQKQLHPKGCMQACIANLLELPIAEVPDFGAMTPDPESKYPIFWIELQSFLRSKGFVMVEVELENRGWMPIPYKFECIICGRTLADSPHMVLGEMDEDKFVGVFDPQTGEEGETSLQNFSKVTAVAFLCAIRPGKMKSTSRITSLIIGE